MSHEIYYTSAPEGIKRGSSGFCTVAATDNIPRPLLERLETLSAYRHQFGVNAGDAAAASNPVSHAHWILSVAARSYHILSRVCDSGVDHTHRTNAFAHHLVVDPAEMAAATGGPAWLLEQPGVMAQSWDGRLRQLPTRTLPTGDASTPTTICHAWARATGDAGWAGHLIDIFIKAPARPVCLLFAPTQNMLTLLQEALALLPPAARWNLTFNTYFTSMPTSATCLWRCCLAGTPAAQIGRRYAANGIFLDLTDPSALGRPPEGPYVRMARSGQVVQQAPRFAPVALAAPPAPDDQPAAPRAPAARALAGEDDGAYELAPGSTDPQLAARAAAIGGSASSPAQRRSLRPSRTIRQADSDLQSADDEADRAAQRRRRHVMILFGGALAAIAVGTGLVWLAYHTYAPPAEPMAPRNSAPMPSPTFAYNPLPAPIPDANNAPVLPAPTQPALTLPAETQAAPVPAPIAPAPQRAPNFPPVITLQTLMELPGVGTGIGDRIQSIPLRAADLDSPARITALQLRFAPTATGPAASVYRNEAIGTVTAASESRLGKPGVAISWKAAGDPASATEGLYIAFDRKKPAIELQWHSGALLRKPEMLNLGYWLIQKATLELIRPGVRGAAGQQINFKSFDPGPLALDQADITVPWPVDLPREVSIVPPPAQTLPAGWEASWYTDWDVKDAALRTAENASQVVKFRKAGPTPDSESWFLLTFRPADATHPALGRVESTFAKRQADAQAELARCEADLHAVNARIDQALADLKVTGGKLEDFPSGRDLLAKKDDAGHRVDAWKDAVDAFAQLTRFDVSFDLPDGLRLATLHFQRSAKADEAGK